MSFYSNKDKMDCNDYKDICRNHSAKTEREMFRVCPSKLSKRELEDLYFNLLENNLELKKTVNGQQDKIRVLSTQVQRLTNTQERLVSREMKDRGTATKAFVDEQKDFISELKETNQRLTDRIQYLNMRLCSAKQFMKTSPPQTAPSRGNRSAATAVSTPKKHDCLSKSPESIPEQVIKVSTFSQWEEKTPRKTNVTQNNSLLEKTPRKTNVTENYVVAEKKPVKSEEQPCDENKCRTLMEELKQKIVTLQNELLNVHGEYATRIGRLETEVIEVRKENIRVLSERSASECELTDNYKRVNELMEKYRSYEAKCAELTAELAIEKRRVTELETQLKAANMSDKVNKTIEEHLTTKQEASVKPDGPRDVAPRVVTPQTGAPQGVSSPDRKQNAGPPKLVPLQDSVPQDVSPPDRKPDAGPAKLIPPQDSVPQDVSPPDPKPDGGPPNVIPRREGRKDLRPRDSIPLTASRLRVGDAKSDSPQVDKPPDGSPSKCECGCRPPAPPTLPPPPPPGRNLTEKSPIKIKPQILSPKKRDHDRLDEASTKSSPTKYSTSKSCSSSYRSNVTETSYDTNCENCGCKSQLVTSVPSPTFSVEVHHYPITPALVNGKCVMCGYAPSPPAPVTPPPPPPPPPRPLPLPPPVNTSTPNKNKKNNVECHCPPRVQIIPSQLSQDTNPKCMKCCVKEEQEKLGQPPTKTNEGQVQGVASPKGDLNSTSTNKSDDSGYQDTSDEQQALLKQNRELMEKVLELQRQVDCLKIGGFCGMPECQSESFSELERSPKKTADNSVASPAVTPPLVELLKASESPEDKPDRANSPDIKNKAPINPPPLQGEPPPRKAEPVEQTEPSPKLNTFGSMISVPSDDHLDLSKRKQRVETLDNPEETENAPVRRLSSDESRKTVIGKQDSTHKYPVPDKYGYPDIPINEHRENNSKHFLKFEVVEKKKREGSTVSIMPRRMDSKTMSLKSVTVGHGFNPEKLKYLEAEGLETETPTGSTAENIPNNPELGYGMPKLRNKVEQARNKAESDFSGTSTPSAQNPGEMVIEKLLASKPSAPAQTDDTRKVEEGCQYCAACSFDKQCAHMIEPTMSKLALGVQKEQAKKHEQHSQVTRASQSLDTGTKEKKGHLRRQKKENQSAEEFIVNPKVYARQTSQTIGGPITLPDVPLLENREPSQNEYIFSMGSEIDQKTLARQKKEKSWKRRKSNQSKEDLFADPKTIAQHACKTAGDAVNLADVPLLEKAVEEKSKCEPGKDSNAGKADTKKTHKEKSRRRSCFKAQQGDVSLYRRRSGTYCFRRGMQVQGTLVCRCASQHDGNCSQKPLSKGTQVAENPENMSPRERRRAVSMSDRATYTLDSKPAANSPDNTDLEMSYLSDLPMEKEKKSPLKSRPLSPGEEKATTSTSTSQGTSPLTDYSLSEGEMPAPATKRKLSEPNRNGVFVNTILAHKEETPPMQQMEAALQAITAELQRCKTLLDRHRPDPLARHPTEPAQGCISAQTSTTSVSRPNLLKPATAQQGIGDTRPPTAVFTLHVGTVVFSDEAVLSTRDKELVLKWKFYNQAVTMARMRAGRVMLFDFSAEYDVQVTEDFLNYLKHEQMPIVICEMDSQEDPFANCALPLRDALLHTNTRADMSIALVAGPQLLKARTTNGKIDRLNSRDEIGVIDLWCMLRTGSDTVPGVIFAIGKPGTLMEKRQSTVKPQSADDSNELELSILHSSPARTHEQTGKNQTYADVGYSRPSDTWSAAPRRQSGDSRPAGPASAGSAKVAYDPSKYPQPRKRKSPHASSSKLQSPDKVSEVIYSEVEPVIKTPEDVKYAFQKSNLLNDLKHRMRSPSEQEIDSTYQPNSSYGSLKSILYRLHKKGSPHPQTQGGDQRNFIEKLRKASHPGERQMKPTVGTEAKDMEIYKNTSFSKLAKTDQSKKVTIQPECLDSEVEKPERDIGEEPTVQDDQKRSPPKLEITVLWLALNGKCEAMMDPRIQRVYIAYSFLGRSGADLETPVSLPKPKHYVEKCYFNFTKVFELEEADLAKLGHMAKCRNSNGSANERDCIIFSVVSEPTEDPLGIETCEDIGYAYLYLGDLLAYSAGSLVYTEVMPVRAANGSGSVSGVLAVRVHGLDVVRRCLPLSSSEKDTRAT